MFKQAVADGRDVLLDNSLFELRETFDQDRFVYWINQLQPTWYIVPDSWKNGKETLKMFDEFTSKNPDLPGKRIGVAQGCVMDEVAECYALLRDRCDMIAFNLDFSSIFYDLYPVKEYAPVPYCVAMSLGRFLVLRELKNRYLIDENKPHHLLGTGVPQEVLWYPKEWTWVRSIDTSNPVTHGMRYVKYTQADGASGLNGLTSKINDRICDHVNDFVNKDQLDTVLYNIKVMREWCK